MFADVICNTSTPQLIDKILQLEVKSEELYFMRLEALWTLLNLATVEDQDDISTLYACSFDQDDEPMQLETGQLSEISQGKSALLASMNLILEENAEGNYRDTTTLNLVIQTLTNMVALSDFKVKMLKETRIL